MAHNFHREGTLLHDALFVGPWTAIEAEAGGVTYVIGVVKEGRIKFGEEKIVHRGAGKFGRVADVALRRKSVVTFEGVFEEINRENVLLFLNRDPNEAKPAPDGEIRIHSLPTAIRFVTLRGKRPNATGTDDPGVEFCLWKCRNVEILRLASNESWWQVPFRFEVLADPDGDYGGSTDQPYGWFYTAQNKYEESAAERYWEFSGVTDALHLDGSDSDAELFSPSLQNNDFSVAGLITPASISNGRDTIIGRCWGTNTYGRMWWVWQKDDNLYASVSRTGTVSTQSHAIVSGKLVAGAQTFIGARYTYSGSPGASSDLKTWVNLDTASNASAHGPIHNNPNADFEICDMTAISPNRNWAGKVYWLAYWNRALTDNEMSSLYNGTAEPWDLSGLAFLIKFGKAVSSTYVSEYGNITLVVEGSPVAG